MARSVDQLRTALLLIDIQNGFNHPSFWGNSRSTAKFEENVARILTVFRRQRESDARSRDGLPLIIHVFHSSLFPGSPLNQDTDSGDGLKFMPFAKPLSKEIVLSKHVNSCFIGTDLEQILRLQEIQQLVICGLTTDHCVSTTTRMAANLGWRNAPSANGHVNDGNVILVGDGCATHNRGTFDAETMHAAALASLKDEFAEVMTTDALIQALFAPFGESSLHS